MTDFKISTGSYKVANKWVAKGVLWVHENITSKQITLGPSEPKFISKEEADQHVHFLARKKLPRNKKI